MVSQRRLERQARRLKDLKDTQGLYATWHDPRTWAENNGGVPINHGEAVLLKKYPHAQNVGNARAMSVAASKEEE